MDRPMTAAASGEQRHAAPAGRGCVLAAGVNSTTQSLVLRAVVLTTPRVVKRTQSSWQGLGPSRHSLEAFSFPFFGTDTEMNLTRWRKTRPVGRDPRECPSLGAGTDPSCCGPSPEAPDLS